MKIEIIDNFFELNDFIKLNSLKLRNELIQWKIHSDDTKNILKDFNIKKSGTWKLQPSLSKPTDEEFIVMENELISRKVGFRNQNKI